MAKAAGSMGEREVIDASATGSDVRAQRLDASALTASDRASWGQLADRAAEPNPFLRPEFVLANMAERGVPVELIVVRNEERWLVCLPVRSRAPTLRLPVPHLEALTDEYSLLGTPLMDRGALTAAAEGFVDFLLGERRVAVLVVNLFAPDGPVGAAIAAAASSRGLKPIVLGEFERAAWRRSSDGAIPGAWLKRSDRRELVRRSRLLGLELGGEPEVVDRSRSPEGWESFLAMENSGWKAEYGTALGSTKADAAFFRRICAAMSGSGLLEVVALEAGGRTVAMECHLVDGGVLYSFKIAHDPTFRTFSPGTQLKYRVIERLYARGLVMGDSCANPLNAHMNRLWPDRRPMQTLLLPTGARSILRPALWGRAAARRVRAWALTHRPGRSAGRN